jgi:hypothetical protein
MDSPVELWSGDNNVQQIIIVKFDPKDAVGEIIIAAVGPDRAPIRVSEIRLEGFPDPCNFERSGYLVGGKDLSQYLGKCGHRANLVPTPDINPIPFIFRIKDGIGQK